VTRSLSGARRAGAPLPAILGTSAIATHSAGYRDGHRGLSAEEKGFDNASMGAGHSVIAITASGDYRTAERPLRKRGNPMRTIAVRIAKITVAALLGVTLASTTATVAQADNTAATSVDVSVAGAATVSSAGETWPWELITRA
jgi:hypothetical protein